MEPLRCTPFGSCGAAEEGRRSVDKKEFKGAVGSARMVKTPSCNTSTIGHTANTVAPPFPLPPPPPMPLLVGLVRNGLAAAAPTTHALCEAFIEERPQIDELAANKKKKKISLKTSFLRIGVKKSAIKHL